MVDFYLHEIQHYWPGSKSSHVCTERINSYLIIFSLLASHKGNHGSCLERQGSRCYDKCAVRCNRAAIIALFAEADFCLVISQVQGRSRRILLLLFPLSGITYIFFPLVFPLVFAPHIYCSASLECMTSEDISASTCSYYFFALINAMSRIVFLHLCWLFFFHAFVNILSCIYTQTSVSL